MEPSSSKTAAVQNYPRPKSAKQVQRYLGLTGYFRKFIPNYSSIAKPLSDLLRKDVDFHFGPEQISAFEQLKEIFSKGPVLHLFKQGSKMELHTDASKVSFGSILLQEESSGELHPIYYYSRKTSLQEEKLSSYELEVLAIISSLKKFRNYLLGTKFTIYTDCAAFKQTMDKKDITPKVARWALFMQDFDYTIKHRTGTQMKHVDALSRISVLLTTRSQEELTMRIATAQDEDEHIKLIKSFVQKEEDNEHVVKQGVLYKYQDGRELLVVPQAMQTEIVREVHNKGHFASAKTEDLLKREFYFPQMKREVENVIKNCVHCILYNKKRGKAEGFLNPIPKENIPLNTYCDFIGPLPSTNKNYQHIFTVIDAFTKFTWLYPVKSTSAKEAIDKLCIQQTTFGNPSRIISDKGSAFTSNEFKEYCQNQNIKHVLITTGVPRGNGQVERLHEILIPVLSKLSIDDPSKWFKHVSSVQRILNSTVSSSTKYTPFKLMIGIEMKNKEDLRIKDTLQDECINFMERQRKELREIAKANILKVQEKSKSQYDRVRKEASVFKKEELVSIQRTQFGTGLKLRPKFFGPYRVTAVKPCDRYDVEKVGTHEGPNVTSTSIDLMKQWSVN